jgi:protein ImuA
MASAAPADFPSVSEGPASLIDRLRRRLRAVEASTGLSDAGTGLVTLGVPPIDGTLGGGLACGALHEIAAERETEIAAAIGFALALAIRRKADHLVWITEELSLAESGVPYGPGLDQAGLPPERLITVTTAHGRDVLWAMEEALRCPAVGAVIGEIRARGIDVVATRRLSLAAAAGNALALLVRTAPDDEPSAAATRWVIGAARALIERPRWPLASLASGARADEPTSGEYPARALIEGPRWPLASLASAARADEPTSGEYPARALIEGPRWPLASLASAAPSSASQAERWGVGPPRLAARLARNRRGHPGAWIVEWNSVEQRFELATDSEPVAGTTLDRPHRAAVA